MPLPYKPHTATVTAKAGVTVSTERTSYIDAVPVSVTGQLTEKTSEEALKAFGIDSRYPAVWLCDLTDAGSIAVGYKMVVNSRTYHVLAGPQKMDAEPITAHARYLLERKV